MQSDEMNNFWTENFGDALPVASALKSKFQERWFRIHTLPNSKRYPDSEFEYNEILGRHNKVLDDLFLSEERFILVSCGFSRNAEPVRSPKIKEIGFQQIFWKTIRLDDEETREETYCHFFIDYVDWKVGLLDSLFRLIANDEISEIMLVSVEGNFVYHPYDGGADLILKDSFTRDSYKQKYVHWLSARPDGL